MKHFQCKRKTEENDNFNQNILATRITRSTPLPVVFDLNVVAYASGLWAASDVQQPVTSRGHVDVQDLIKYNNFNMTVLETVYLGKTIKINVKLY